MADLGIDLNVTDKGGYSPMSLAALHGHDEVIRILHLLGANINEGISPLHIAIDNGNDSAVQVLIELGADVNIVDIAITGGTTPLCAAIGHNRVNMCQVLIEAGADIDLVSEVGNFGYMPPIFVSISLGNIDIIGMLVANGANIDRHADGMSLMTHAASTVDKFNNPENVNNAVDNLIFLVNVGADISQMYERDWPNPTIVHGFLNDFCEELKVTLDHKVFTMFTMTKLMTNVWQEARHCCN